MRVRQARLQGWSQNLFENGDQIGVQTSSLGWCKGIKFLSRAHCHSKAAYLSHHVVFSIVIVVVVVIGVIE